MVNSTGQASNIFVITGTNRDEAGVLVDDYPANSTTFTAYVSKAMQRYHLDPTLLPTLSDAFSPSANATAARILNATLAVSTDGEFACFDMAKAYSGARHGAFRSVYAYQFNRTYQTAGYTKPWCVPPATAARPNGDPDAEYFKCHAGEQLVVFGNVRRAGRPDRDGRDVPFTRLVVDYWAAFARTGDPNPETAYLAARAYHDTLAQTQAAGRWETVSADKPTLRLLQWDGRQVPFREGTHCAALGIPLDVLER